MKGTVLVLLGFACWFGAWTVIPTTSVGFFAATHAVGGIAFFLVSCFLPEYRNPRAFLGRRSALQLMAALFWLSGNEIARLKAVQGMQIPSGTLAFLQLAAPVAIALSSYFIATYLIRGFRATPDYFTPEDPPKPGPENTANPVPAPEPRPASL